MADKNNPKIHILKLIKQYEPVTIKGLSGLCRLSIPNVTTYVDELLGAGLLTEQIDNTVAAGRKPKLYSVNPGYGYIIGIDMGLLDYIRIGIFNIAGELIDSANFSHSSYVDGREVIYGVIDAVKTHLQQLEIVYSQVFCIVIANPGVINPEDGSIATMSASSVLWGNFPLKHIFEKEFSTNVVVMNDVNLCSIGEKESGLGKGYKNFVFIRNDIGMKAGIIIKNRLYQGEKQASGEIGQNVMLCKEGDSFSCMPVETELSLQALVDKVTVLLDKYPNDPLHSTINDNPNQVNIENMLKVQETDSYVNKVIIDYGEFFGYVLLNLSTILDIDLIIVSGKIVQLGNYYFKPVREVLANHLQFPPTVLISSLGEDVGLYGAYSVGLEYFYDSLKK